MIIVVNPVSSCNPSMECMLLKLRFKYLILSKLAVRAKYLIILSFIVSTFDRSGSCGSKRGRSSDVLDAVMDCDLPQYQFMVD